MQVSSALLSTFTARTALHSRAVALACSPAEPPAALSNTCCSTRCPCRYCTLCDARTRPSCLPCTKQRSAQQLQAGFDALADERLQQLLAATLEHLAGALWQRRRWKRHAWPGATFLLHPFTRLRRLQVLGLGCVSAGLIKRRQRALRSAVGSRCPPQFAARSATRRPPQPMPCHPPRTNTQVSQCYSPVGKQAPAPVRVGGACWEQHEYLEDLEVHGPAEVTGLPPRLRRLAVWGGPVTAELAVLARCPCVELNCGQHHSFGVCFYTPDTDHTEPLAMGEGVSGEQQAYYLAEAAALAGSEGCPALRRLEVRCRHLCFLDMAGSFRSMSHTSAHSAGISFLACAVGDTSLAIDFGFQSEFQGQYAAAGPMARLVLACEPPPVVAAGKVAALVD